MHAFFLPNSPPCSASFSSFRLFDMHPLFPVQSLNPRFFFRFFDASSSWSSSWICQNRTSFVGSTPAMHPSPFRRPMTALVFTSSRKNSMISGHQSTTWSRHVLEAVHPRRASLIQKKHHQSEVAIYGPRIVTKQQDHGNCLSNIFGEFLDKFSIHSSYMQYFGVRANKIQKKIRLENKADKYRSSRCLERAY